MVEARHEANSPSISYSRSFDAPRDLVFQSWIDAEEMRNWFAPDGFEVTACELEPRVGGAWRVEFSSPTGERHCEFGEFIEISPPQKLVFSLTQSSGDRRGPRTIVTVALTDANGKTDMQFSQTGYASADVRDGNFEGWKECFAKLDVVLKSMMDERDIRALHLTWFDVSSAKDIDAAMAPIAADCVSYEHGAPLEYIGREAIRAVCLAGFQNMPDDFRWDMPDLKIIVQGDLAVAWGLNHMRSLAKDGPAIDMWSRGTRVFQRVSGEWKMVHQHVSFPYEAATGQVRMDLTPA